MRKYPLLAFLLCVSFFTIAQIRRIPTPIKSNSDSNNHSFATDSTKLNRAAFLKDLNLTREQQIKLKEIKNESSASIDQINNDAGLSDKEKKISTRKIRMGELQTVKTLLSPEQFEKFKAHLNENRKRPITGNDAE